MIRNSVLLPALVGISLAASELSAAPYSVAQLDVYRQQGVEQADPQRGRQLWYARSERRSCTSCHGENPADSGKHVKTGKVIEPMAPSANPDRYQDAKKIEKWFLRNCKWTYGRECSQQEKADILTWLAGR